MGSSTNNLEFCAYKQLNLFTISKLSYILIELDELNVGFFRRYKK